MADLTPDELLEVPDDSEPGSVRMHLVTGHRCHARDGRDQRCALVGEHQVITNSGGQKAVVHETKYSLWSTPIVSALSAPREDPR